VLLVIVLLVIVLLCYLSDNQNIMKINLRNRQ